MPKRARWKLLKLTLAEAGFLRCSETKIWVGDRGFIADQDLKGLQLHELDQILAGMRDGQKSVALGPNRTFWLK